MQILKISAWPLALALVTGPALAGTFKWIDEQGVTHYSDRIPTQYKDRGGYELNKRGVVIKRIEPAPTTEQRRAKEDESARAAAEEQRLTDQRRKDAALLNTYTSEREIEQKRDRDLRQVELSFNEIQSSLKAAQNRLAGLRNQATLDVQAKKVLPDGLADDIAKAETEKQQLENLAAGKRQEMDGIRVKYDDYKKRFTELKRAENSQRASAP